jgi:hypothetical protein
MDKVVSPEDFVKLPWWFRALNRSWKATYFASTKVSLDKDGLIRSAKKATGLSDFGKDFWDEPLDRMLNSIKEEAELHPIGRFISRERIVNLLANRLRAEYYFNKHPEILDRDLYPVWMIAGLQRTGTTKLQRLLNADPDNRVLASWEAINPAPFLKQARGEDKRLKKARTAEKALKVMAPGFFAIHPVEYLAPEEDILLLDITFLSTTPEATMHVPSYASWLEKTDQTMAYEYAAKLMKLLQWQKPAKRWILKSPHHLEFLHLAEKVFGDVRFLWTHRDPCISIPSFLSMMSHSRAMFSNATSLKQVADHWVRKSTFILEKGMEYRITQPQEKFLDIKYENLVGDSQLELEGIYGNVDDELRRKFETAENENPPQKYGKHVYSLEDFGLKKQDIIDKIPKYEQFFKGTE